jgi:hypothetical protein
MMRARVMLSISVLALAALTIWVRSQAAANTQNMARASACCLPDCCSPDCCPDCCPECCAETKHQTSVKRTEDCCEPTCCNGEELKSTPAKQECRSSGGCCAK